MEFSEVEGPAELPQVNESGKPPGGSKNSYYMCYGCPPDYKERAVMEVNGHNYCYKHAMEAIQELIDDEAN